MEKIFFIGIYIIICCSYSYSQTTFQYDTKGNQTTIVFSGTNPCQPGNALVLPDNNQPESNRDLNVVIEKDSTESKKTSKFALKVYPNPSSDYIMIEYSLDKDHSITLSIYNYSGQLSAQVLDAYHYSGTYQTRFDMKNLPPGIYTCLLVSDTGTESVKVVKIGD